MQSLVGWGKLTDEMGICNVRTLLVGGGSVVDDRLSQDGNKEEKDREHKEDKSDMMAAWPM